MSGAILVVNPGSTSTKIAVFQGGAPVFAENLAHSAEQIAVFPRISAQLEFREAQVRAALARGGFELARIVAVVGRGGLLRPIQGGIYRVNEIMKEELATARFGEHASNLGALIADRLASEIGVPAFIADPVVVDELSDLSRVSGHKLFRRRSIFHALNQKAVCRRWCRENDRAYAQAVLIVAHLGGGVSIGLHSGGRVVDVNNALDGEGPFSPERSGSLPCGDLIRLCFSGKSSEKEILAMVTGKGGLVSFMGTNDMRDAEKGYLAGEPQASLYYRAFIYQVGKAIGALAAAAEGKVDAIILTGGIAFSSELCEGVKRMCGFIAPVLAYPGEGELEALAEAGERGLAGEARDYTGEAP